MMGMLGMSRRRCAAEGRAAAIRRSGVGGAISTSDTGMAVAAEGMTGGTMSFPPPYISGTCAMQRWQSGWDHCYLSSLYLEPLAGSRQLVL